MWKFSKKSKKHQETTFDEVSLHLMCNRKVKLYLLPSISVFNKLNLVASLTRSMLGKVNLIKLKLKISVKSPLMLHSSNASRNKQNLRSLLPKSFLRTLRLDFTEYQSQNLHIKRWENFTESSSFSNIFSSFNQELLQTKFYCVIGCRRRVDVGGPSSS